MNTFVNPMTDDWTLTDGDTEQWGKKVSLSEFHFYNNDSVDYCRETPCVVDLKIQSWGDIISTMHNYGYSLMPFSTNYILNLHSREEACWLIAEALYETCHRLK